MLKRSHAVFHERDTLYRLILSALFLSIGLLLPFFTGQIRLFGQMLLPMHIPVMLCGLICGWLYGAVVGVALPITRCLMFGMPALFPDAISMGAELAVYGLVAGLIYGMFKRQSIGAVYVSILPAMLLGRLAWGGMQCLLLGVGETGFSHTAFLFGAFFNAIPGIILQLILIPAVISTLHVTRLQCFRGRGGSP